MGQLHDEASRKTPNIGGFRGLQVGEHIHPEGQWAAHLCQDRSSCAQDPPRYFFIWLLTCILLNILQIGKCTCLPPLSELFQN